jgi:hypothetical protein
MSKSHDLFGEEVMKLVTYAESLNLEITNIDWEGPVWGEPLTIFVEPIEPEEEGNL